VEKFKFLLWKIFATQGEWHVVRPSITSNSPLSFLAKELKFPYRLFILMAKKLPRGFLKFHFRAELGIFSRLTSNLWRMACRSTIFPRVSSYYSHCYSSRVFHFFASFFWHKYVLHMKTNCLIYFNLKLWTKVMLTTLTRHLFKVRKWRGIHASHFWYYKALYFLC